MKIHCLSMCSKEYYNDISKLSTYSDEQLLQEFQTYLDGDERAYNRLVEGNLKLVIVIAKSYTTESYQDLVSEGNIGLMEAVKRFQPSKNVKFSHYAKIWIKKFMNDFIINDNTIKIQHNKYYEMKNNNTMLIKLLNDFEEIFESIEDDEDDQEEFDIEKLEQVVKASKQLNNGEQNVITLYYGIGCEKKNLVEIAKELGITKQRVSQIKIKAVEKIRKLLGVKATAKPSKTVKPTTKNDEPRKK